MKIKTTYESDCDTRIYATDPGWYCQLGADNTPVQLGIYGYVINTDEYGGEGYEGFPFNCQFGVVVHSPAINDDVLRTLCLDRDYFAPFENDPEAQAEAIREALQDYGSTGVPVDDLLVNGIRKHTDQNALQALLKGIDSAEVKLVDRTHWLTGQSRAIPWFASWEAAETFVKRALEKGDTLMGLIGFTLDRPVNMVGADGWSMIRAQVEGKDWDPMPKVG